MPDVEIPCVQCKEIFLFTEKEQETFYRQNLMQPQRCQKCRSKKAAGGGNASTRFEIICDHCGKHDHVPFQPKVGRSVLCKECHQASKARMRSA
ncbi:MAG TPA: CxxC-x17-CxxC domain-containing protein [Pyrinomonadaceae bacterium]|jgi:CxxC-x17-CxxC domain-containing protein